MVSQQVPDAQVIIVGTQVDHAALNRTILEQIWQQLREMLSDARDHHQRHFSPADRLSDCLLCQTDPRCRRPTDGSLPVASDGGVTEQPQTSWFVNHAFDDSAEQMMNGSVAHSDDDDDDDTEEVLSRDHHADDRRMLMFPHVVGFYEVSSTTGQGVGHLRDAVTELAGKLIASNPQIPRRWCNVERSLAARSERSGSVCRLDELKDIISVQGIDDSQDVINVIHFFRAQGRILHFPQVTRS